MLFDLLITRTLNRMLAILVMLMMFTMLSVIFVGVVCRFLLNFSPTWTEELARYLMVWICFLGAPLAVGIGGHVGVQTLVAKIPSKARKIVRIITVIFINLFLLIVAKKGYDLLLLIFSDESPALGIPMGYVYLAVPVGCVFLFIEFFYVIIVGPKNGEYVAFTTGGEF